MGHRIGAAPILASLADKRWKEFFHTTTATTTDALLATFRDCRVRVKQLSAYQAAITAHHEMFLRNGQPAS